MPPESTPRPAKLGPAHWIAAVISLIYGFAKLNGSQFTVLDSELSKPMGEVSGFWLTWYYFGYSAIYGNLIALTQIGGAILLVLPRTSVLGALILLPLVTNIILVDVFFAIDPGATVVAIIFLLCLLWILSRHVNRLWRAVILDAPLRPRLLPAMALILLMSAAGGFTWWTANYNNRAPTPIDGVWTVAGAPTRPDGPAWQYVFFEYNRAFLAVFRTDTGNDAWLHFEVDDEGTVQVWQRWLSKGDLLMEGQVMPDGSINLTVAEDGGQLLLQRLQGGTPRRLYLGSAASEE